MGTVIFWTLTFSGYAIGLIVAGHLGGRVVGKVARDGNNTAQIVRAGKISGHVALLPAVVFATLLGGGLGRTIAAGIVNPATSQADNIMHAALFGVAIALGVSLSLVLIIVTTRAAGAVFMKAYLARKP